MSASLAHTHASGSTCSARGAWCIRKQRIALSAWMWLEFPPIALLTPAQGLRIYDSSATDMDQTGLPTMISKSFMRWLREFFPKKTFPKNGRNSNLQELQTQEPR